MYKLIFSLLILFFSFSQYTWENPFVEFTIFDCLMPIEFSVDGQNCLAMIHRYHWNHEKQKCEGVTWGGCGATKNNFETMKECLTVAGAICDKFWYWN
ncbi:unnamed protein product [Psylliodes chrysocephalus]|uniref:BPTI/Kunitz inhibitor domain-containing protein n=1 Tax=Psylliodes chrysocephalus TaxID=3402493 RepID=A0A9P0GGC7_9CUCU|nr:unnamed protein product [Psylliodes chrysocephala]